MHFRLLGRGPSALRFVWLVLFVLVSFQSLSQRWLPEFKIRIGHRPITDMNMVLIEFLDQNHYFLKQGCNTRMSVFYFRVNSTGKVDTLYSQGNFSDEEKSLINKNILNTSENWVLPANTSREDACWFVYPCFVFGQLKEACSQDPANQRQLEILHKLLFSQAHQFDELGRYRLPPNNFKVSNK